LVRVAEFSTNNVHLQVKAFSGKRAIKFDGSVM
jgi:hypothetical protein